MLAISSTRLRKTSLHALRAITLADGGFQALTRCASCSSGCLGIAACGDTTQAGLDPPVPSVAPAVPAMDGGEGTMADWYLGST